jgi:hypothetical protein
MQNLAGASQGARRYKLDWYDARKLGHPPSSDQSVLRE